MISYSWLLEDQGTIIIISAFVSYLADTTIVMDVLHVFPATFGHTPLISSQGSAFVVLEILRDRKKKAQVYHRIMLGLATSNMLSSIFFGISTWPIPSGTEYVYDARGNEATCRAQGFFLVLSLAGPMYNTALVSLMKVVRPLPHSGVVATRLRKYICRPS